MQVFNFADDLLEIVLTTSIRGFKRLHKSPIADYSVETISEDRVQVTFQNEDGKTYACIYRRMDKQDVYDLIRQGKPLDLRGCYIKDFNIKDIEYYQDYILEKFDARYSFWDGRVSFEDATFGDGYLSFEGTTFGDGDVSFEFATFGDGDVSFNFSTFGDGEVSFEFATFGEGDVRFWDTTFGEGDVRFGGTTFGDGEVSFWRATFGEGDVSFNFSTFGDGDVLFDMVSYGERVHLVFEGIKFNEELELDVEGLHKLTLYRCILKGVTRINGYPEQLSLLDTDILGRLRWTWDKQIKQSINTCRLSKAEKASQFQLLKENYHTIGEYGAEDKAYKAYMDCYTRKWYRIPLKIFGLIGGYGTKPLSIIPAMLGTWVGFAIAYFFALPDQFHNGLLRFGDALYYSGITFLTIGYGEIHPLYDWARFLSVGEGFIGLFLMSYLTVAVVRKLLR